MRHHDLARFIQLREDARIRKEHPSVKVSRKPDSIITTYRFCNVRRNDDRVTKFVIPWIKQFPAGLEWFAAVVARLFNNEPTLTEITAQVVPFNPKRMKAILHERKRLGQKNFNAAYIVSTNGRAMDKVDYVVDIILAPLWEKRAAITASLKGATLDQAQELFMAQQGMASFMAAQVLADLKYLEPRRWPDFHTFCASGPGSKRGLNIVCHRDIGEPWREADFRETLLELRKKVNDVLMNKYGWTEPLTAQDIQNCLCEYSKYVKAQRGGKPKQLYRPFDAQKDK